MVLFLLLSILLNSTVLLMLALLDSIFAVVMVLIISLSVSAVVWKIVMVVTVSLSVLADLVWQIVTAFL